MQLERFFLVGDTEQNFCTWCKSFCNIAVIEFWEFFLYVHKDHCSSCLILYLVIIRGVVLKMKCGNWEDTQKTSIFK